MTDRGNFEVEEDRTFQERFWTAQRFAWSAMGLFIVAALAGATGSGGPLADAVAETPGGTIEYPRIARWQAAERMTVRVCDRRTIKPSSHVQFLTGNSGRVQAEVMPQPCRA